jgi:L-rhamnose mutarotase
MKRYCLALDLKDDPELIAAYEAHHEAVWPEVLESIKASGIEHMEIYRVSNRLFMIMEVNDKFTFERKALFDIASNKVQQWELIMWKYQQRLPFARPGEKWVLMDRIFAI